MNNYTNDLISIVVPVYNAEKTIRQTLVSLQNQDYHNIEIVLVNDGSTDASEQICLEIQKNDNRIILYSIDNSGPSVARQYGIERARGQYVAFCDADDIMELTMISTLYELMRRNNSQLSVCLFERNIDATNQTRESVEVWDKGKAIYKCMEDDSIGGYLWNKLFDLSIIQENKIRFDRTVFYCEDLEFVIEYILKCEKITFTTKSLYHYTYQDHSLSAETVSWKKLTNLFAREKIHGLLYKSDMGELTKIAEKKLVLQSIFAGRLLEKAAVVELNKLTQDQFKKITDTIKRICRMYGINVIVRRECSLKNVVNIIRFGYLKRWKTI